MGQLSKLWSKRQALRQDQLTQFELLAARLSALNDDKLEKMRVEHGERVARLRFEKGTGDDAWLDAELLAEMAFADILVGEINYRLGVVWDAESEMMGGHRTPVSKDDETLGTWRAKCAPWWENEAEYCWEGSERPYVEDAIEDAQRHNPGYEPWHVEM